MAKTGRPKKQIDKNDFEKLCALHCTLVEICAFLEVTDKTLYKWIKQTYGGYSFSEIFQIKSAAGNISLRRYQFELAKRNPNMAIWLGKQYLGQRDKPVEEEDNSVDECPANIEIIVEDASE